MEYNPQMECSIQVTHRITEGLLPLSNTLMSYKDTISDYNALPKDLRRKNLELWRIPNHGHRLLLTSNH